MPLKKSSTKTSNQEKHAKAVKVTKGSTASTMKMTMSPASTMAPRLHHKKVLRLAGKRPGAHRTMSGKGRPCIRQSVDACDNSDDSGLGFDHAMDMRALHYSDRHWMDEVPDIKRRKLELKLEQDETNDNYCFPETLKTCKDNSTIIRTIPNTGIQNISRAVGQTVTTPKVISRCLPMVSRRSIASNGPITLTTQLNTSSRNGKFHLQIMSQPEQQHRARYQTEGSRGAVKDRSGNSFPIVKLIGYEKPTTLQVFIGTDQGRVAPHMFYQACRVSGKNSTPCIEKKIEGTIVIEVELEPSKEMIATCDCVGILKERNVDVEHRFPEQIGSRNKKKSTRCRMVFRTSITNEDGSTETLQVCSQPIVCTQPPGIPEICKKSLTSCPVSGGLELFILGKNFLKDTKVVFQQAGNVFDGSRESEIIWEECVSPDKEYLQQTHLVCVVPPYVRQDIAEPVTVRLFVISSGKNSEAHSFIYTPAAGPSVHMEPNQTAPFLSKMLWNTTNKQELNIGMMPPPTTLVPVAQRRPSTLMDNHSPPMRSMKTEMIDENSQGSVMEHMMNENSVDSIRHRFRPMSESSMDVQEESNIAMINENTVDMMRRQEIINENSNVSVNESFHEKSNHSIQNEDSVESIHSPVVQMTVLPTPVLVPTMEIPPNITDLKGVDLRMKGIIPNDLADTQPPSMATLLKFGVTEPTNMPLPTQSGQSIENFFLTTLENTVNKPVLSNSLANNKSEKTEINKELILNNQLGQLLTETTGTKIYTDQVITPENLLGTPEIIPALTESHVKPNFDNEQMIFPPSGAKITNEVLKEGLIAQQIQALSSTIIPSTNTPTDALKTDARLILSQQSLQVALNTNLLPTATPKLDALVNSTVESHIGSPTRSPQEIITNSPELIRRSPLQPPEIIINPTPEVLLNPQAPLLSQTLSPGNEILIRSPQNEIPQDILNPQVPSVMCAPEILGTNLIAQNLETCLPNQIQPESIPNMNLGIKVTMSNDCLLPTQEIIDPHLMGQKALIFEQQKDLMNNLLIQQQQFDNTTVINNVIEEKPSNFQQETIKVEVKPETGRPCQEMIPPALTNMSETDLISYINPSCFEGTYTT